MGKEYDLINELGPRNWLDCVAGEAVKWGHYLKDPCLTAKGTELASLIRKIYFDKDSFCKVEAIGQALEKELAERKEKEKTIMFIDELSIDKWELEFIYADGRHYVQMSLPFYEDETMFFNPKKMEIENRVREKYADPSFVRYRKTVTESVMCDDQIILKTRYFDKDKKVIRETVDFNHHQSKARGWIEYYYFDDCAKAYETWREAKEVATSDQMK